jgi:hypothetical protein
MTANPMAVTYEGLPLASGGAHRLGRLGVREAYTRTRDFIAACALVTSGPVFTLDEGAERTILSGEGQVDDALWLYEQHPSGTGGVSLRIEWDIEIVDPVTALPFPGQGTRRFPGLGFNSRVTLVFDPRASLSIELCIPDLDDDRLRVLLPVLQAHAPFRFSAKAWRRWTATPAGAFVPRKIDLS